MRARWRAGGEDPEGDDPFVGAAGDHASVSGDSDESSSHTYRRVRVRSMTHVDRPVAAALAMSTGSPWRRKTINSGRCVSVGGRLLTAMHRRAITRPSANKICPLSLPPGVAAVCVAFHFVTKL